MRILPLAATAILFAAGTAHADIKMFRSPSGNINCMYDHSPGVVECQIPQPDRPVLPKPRDCELDWGSNFSIARTGRTQMGCVAACCPTAKPCAATAGSAPAAPAA